MSPHPPLPEQASAGHALDPQPRASEDNPNAQLVKTLREQIDDLLQQVSQLNGKVRPGGQTFLLERLTHHFCSSYNRMTAFPILRTHFMLHLRICARLHSRFLTWRLNALSISPH